MVDLPKIIRGNGVDVYKNNNSKILKTMSEDFNKICDYMYDMKSEKIVSKHNAVPGKQANLVVDRIFENNDIFKLCVSNSEYICKALSEKGYAVKDNTVVQANEYCWTSCFGNQKGELTKIGVAVNGGYTLDMNYLYKFCGSYGIDIKKNVEELFNLVKSYWNVVKDDGETNETKALKSVIEEKNRALDDIRIKFWKQLTMMQGAYSDTWEFFNINPTDPRYRDIIWFKDPWIVFSIGFSLMKSSKGEMDSLICFDLGSLMSDNNKRILGLQPYPIRVYTIFNVDSRFFGGFKYTRPDGRSY